MWSWNRIFEKKSLFVSHYGALESDFPVIWILLVLHVFEIKKAAKLLSKQMTKLYLKIYKLGKNVPLSSLSPNRNKKRTSRKNRCFFLSLIWSYSADLWSIFGCSVFVSMYSVPRAAYVTPIHNKDNATFSVIISLQVTLKSVWSCLLAQS